MNPKQLDLQPQSAAPPSSVTDGLLKDLRHLIDHARASIASTINAGLTTTYWRVGNRVLKEILHGKIKLSVNQFIWPLFVDVPVKLKMGRGWMTGDVDKFDLMPTHFDESRF